MGFKKDPNANYLLHVTELENLFISEYMPSADGTYVKAYLLALMCAEANLPMDNHYLAKQLSVPIDIVHDAWAYWEAKNLVRRRNSVGGGKDDYDVEFLAIKDMVFGGANVKSLSKPVPKAVSLGNADLKKLFDDIQNATGRLLDNSEPEAIASLITEYGMSPEMILFGYKYCAGHAKSTKNRYVSAILKDWSAKGLTTVAEIEEHLAGIDKHYDAYRKIFKSLGFNRNPSEPEKRLMDSWLDEMCFTLDEIFSAINKTTGISNPNLNYVNTILVSAYKDKESPKNEKSDIVSDIEGYYDRIRKENAEKTAARRKEIFTKLPRIKDIMSELGEAGNKISMCILKGAAGKEELEENRMKIKQLNLEKAHLLEINGFAADAADTIYTCKDCQDTGLLEDGSRCHCYKEKAEKLVR